MRSALSFRKVPIFGSADSAKPDVGDALVRVPKARPSPQDGRATRVGSTDPEDRETKLALANVQSGHFAVLIDRGFSSTSVEGSFAQRAGKDLKVSAAGTTIELEGSDIHIEAAGLLVDYLNHLRAARAGGPMLELLEGRVAAG